MPPYIIPNSYTPFDFTYFLASNNAYDNNPNIPKLIKLSSTGEQLPFIPNCVLNYFLREVRQALIYDGNYYVASGSPSDASSAIGGTIYRINIETLNAVLDTLLVSDICFVKDTPIETDQGIFPIQNLTSANTIRKQPIVAITKTKYDEYLICFEKDALGKDCPSAPSSAKSIK